MNAEFPTMGDMIDDIVRSAKFVYETTGNEDAALLGVRNKQFVADEARKQIDAWIVGEKEAAAKRAAKQAEAEALAAAEFQIELGNVKSVYSGRVGCMCGCNGSYRYSSTSSYAEKYGTDDESVSDRSVKIQVGKMNKRLAFDLPKFTKTETKEYSGDVFEIYELNNDAEFNIAISKKANKVSHIYYEEGERCWCVYMDD